MSGRAMSTAVSGLRDQQVMLDVIANNISNSGTIGFKRSRVTFKESFAVLLQALRVLRRPGRGQSAPGR